jgi:hypothetical protein
MKDIELIANAEFGGHVTIMKFTTGWKVVFGTPALWEEDRSVISDLPSRMSLLEALDVAKALRRDFNRKGDKDGSR